VAEAEQEDKMVMMEEEGVEIHLQIQLMHMEQVMEEEVEIILLKLLLKQEQPILEEEEVEEDLHLQEHLEQVEDQVLLL